MGGSPFEFDRAVHGDAESQREKMPQRRWPTKEKPLLDMQTLKLMLSAMLMNIFALGNWMMH